jgi:hypothetical protein
MYLKTNGVLHIENIIVEIAVIVSTCILAIILASFDSTADLIQLAHADQGLTIEHNIQARSQLNNCSYFVSISVLDNKTMRSIPNALVEFNTPLAGIIANTTDQGGSTSISLSLEKKPQEESCFETLISQGYAIEATSKGYIGHGISTIS